jgi:hypothetical protein
MSALGSARSICRNLTVPLLFTFAVPALLVAAMYASARFFPGSNSAALAILVFLPAVFAFAYVYFSLALARKKMFRRYNGIKSAVLIVVLLEIYRRCVLALMTGASISTTALIKKHCGIDTDNLEKAILCASSSFGTYAAMNIIWWLMPAIALEIVSSRIAPSIIRRPQ